MLQKVHDAGDIYFGEYGGKYCYGCERFYADRELVDGKCPDHETEPVWIREENYFFRMSRYQQRLARSPRRAPRSDSPGGYRNEVLGLLREPLEDLCISRPKSRLTWGIELPFDRDYVTYVWFDALAELRERRSSTCTRERCAGVLARTPITSSRKTSSSRTRCSGRRC